MKLKCFLIGSLWVFSVSTVFSDTLSKELLLSEELNVYDFWAGEYPKPVIQVNENISHNAVLSKTNDLKKDLSIGSKLPCQISKNLYHPWVKQHNVKYVTLVSSDRFKLKKIWNVVIPGTKIKSLPIGQIVTINAFLSEGLCNLSTVVDGKKIKFDDYCPDDGNMEKLAAKSARIDQKYMQVSCDKKHKGWILVDDQLLAHPAISQGKIIEWGKVKKVLPPQKNPQHNEF